MQLACQVLETAARLKQLLCDTVDLGLMNKPRRSAYAWESGIRCAVSAKMVFHQLPKRLQVESLLHGLAEEVEVGQWPGEIATGKGKAAQSDGDAIEPFAFDELQQGPRRPQRG